jgi:hypothetical protein
MANSKQYCATWVELMIVAIVFTILGVCVYISLMNVPIRKENITVESSTSTPRSASHSVSQSTSVSKTAINDPLKYVSFVPIQQPTTPKTRLIKLIRIHPEHKP